MQTATAALTHDPLVPTAAADIPLLLVVEPDARAREACAAVLARAGYRTIQARTGFEALIKACWHRPAAVLLGLLGDAGGVGGDATIDLLSGCPDTAAIPVIRLLDARTALSEVNRRLA
jgi:CheY-like chemotaxis protein